VKVGRAALDEDAIRLIEEHNADIDFDWTRILKGQGDPAPEKDRRQPPGRDRREGRGQPPSPHREKRGQPPFPAGQRWQSPVSTGDASVSEATGEDAAEAPLPEPVPDGPVTPAQERLGSEGLSRLRGRYAEMLARISERVQDVERQAELKTLAERLNPDAWVTADDVTAGLDGYETTFESLRSVVGHRRRRRRRPQRGQPEAE
jgi:hypothetical protein